MAAVSEIICWPWVTLITVDGREIRISRTRSFPSDCDIKCSDALQMKWIAGIYAGCSRMSPASLGIVPNIQSQHSQNFLLWILSPQTYLFCVFCVSTKWGQRMTISCKLRGVWQNKNGYTSVLFPWRKLNPWKCHKIIGDNECSLLTGSYHQVALKMLWTHFSWAPMTAVFVWSKPSF